MKIRIMVKIVTAFVVLVLGSMSAFSQQNQSVGNSNSNGGAGRAKYVIYMIGDGMGLAHTSLVEYIRAAVGDSIGFVALEMNKMPVYGMVTTHAKTRFITGSAAAATALATGHKTHISSIAYDSIIGESFESIATMSKLAGERVGVISTGFMNDATPAAFYAHAKNRNMYDDIARQLVSSGVDFFGGGGIITVENSSFDAKKELENGGYRVVDNSKQFRELQNDGQKTYFFADELTSMMSMPYRIDNNIQISLAEITDKAIELLYNPSGFLLVVESSSIDWASHNNDAAAIYYEIEDFDKAIKVAIDFYMKHQDETLVIVTSDHETGGLALGYRDMKYNSEYDIVIRQKHSHTEMKQLIKNHFGKLDAKLNQREQSQNLFDELGFSEELLLTNPKIKSRLEKIYGNQDSLVSNKNIDKIDYTYFANDYIKIFNNFAGIDFTTYKHTASPVPVRAIGVGSEQFSGFMDNTAIPKNIIKAKTLKIERK